MPNLQTQNQKNVIFNTKLKFMFQVMNNSYSYIALLRQVTEQ